MSLSVSVASSSTRSATFDRSAMAERVSKRMMSDMDTDKSGSLDKKEFVAGLKDKGVSEEDASKQFDAIDTQKTGKISQADLQSAVESGKAGPPAGAGGKPPPGGAGGKEGAGGGGGSTKTYEAADANKDGTVSSQEELVYKMAHPTKTTGAQSEPSKLGKVVDTTA